MFLGLTDEIFCQSQKCLDEGIACAVSRRKNILSIIDNEYFNMDKICPIIDDIKKCFYTKTPSCESSVRKEAESYLEKFCSESKISKIINLHFFSYHQFFAFRL